MGWKVSLQVKPTEEAKERSLPGPSEGTGGNDGEQTRAVKQVFSIAGVQDS